MSSNCPTYVKPQALFYYYPWTSLQALPWHLHPHQQVGSGLQGWLGLQHPNWGLTESFLLENTHESQYSTPKIKSLSVNPMGCIVPRVLQDFCYQSLWLEPDTKMRKALPHSMVCLAKRQKSSPFPKWRALKIIYIYLHTTKAKN